MICVVLIDDEKPALRELDYLLGGSDDVEVAGMYTDPFKGMEAVAELKPQAVFLDIHMPQLMGTDLASMILDRCPDIHIVFVTAYDQYAVEAFELYALDYILKPVTQARLQKTINRIRIKTQSHDISGKRLSVRCFGAFEIGWEGEEPIKWRTEKTRELFGYLLHNRGRTATKSEIIDAVWPDAVPERAEHQLHNAIYYIRKTLSNYGIARDLLCISGCYRLELNGAVTDVDRFKEQCGQHKASNGNLHCISDMYKGAYFANTGWLWAEAERESLSRKYTKAVLALSEKRMNNGDFEAAETMLIEACRHIPYEESVTEMLLKLYAHTGEKTKAIQHYKAYSEVLKHELNIKPSRNIVQHMNTFME